MAIKAERAADVRRLVDWHGRERSFLLTLTIPHGIGNDLRTSREAVSVAYRRMIAGAPWKRIAARFGFVGAVRAMEVTHGRNGWHPHIHAILLLCDLTAKDREELRAWIAQRWIECVKRVLGSDAAPSLTFGCDLRPCRRADYVAKLGLELTAPIGKNARDGNRSPLEIAGDFLATGDEADIDLWQAYAVGMKGARMLTWSQGVRAAAGFTEEERGLLKPIRTMGGQRRYYLSALQDVLASAESDEDDDAPASAPATARTSPPSPPTREPSVWDEVEEEKASFEALKIRSQRDIFVRSHREDEERFQRERQAHIEAERRESQARAAREAAALDQQRAVKEYQSRVQFELSLAELRLAFEPREAHAAIRKAVLALLTPARIPVGTPPDRISRLVQDEIQTVVAPFKRALCTRAGAMKYAERALSDGALDYLEKKRLRESVEAELAAQVTPDWTPRRAERLVDSLLDELWPNDD